MRWRSDVPPPSPWSGPCLPEAGVGGCGGLTRWFVWLRDGNKTPFHCPGQCAPKQGKIHILNTETSQSALNNTVEFDSIEVESNWRSDGAFRGTRIYHIHILKFTIMTQRVFFTSTMGIS